MTMAKTRRRAMAVFAVAILAAWTRAADAPPAKPPAPPRPTSGRGVLNALLGRVTISRETTFITAPLRPDGYPDYLEALNQHASQGVTPDNNAAVLLWQIVGPAKIPPARREEYFKRLGIKPLPEKGDYFQTPEEYRKAHQPQGAAGHLMAGEAEDQAEKNELTAASRPWSAQEFPELAAWLAANDKALDRFVEASKRPRSYGPMISDSGLFMNVAQPEANEFPTAAHALAVRAVFRIQLGRLEQAFQDDLACHRLSILMEQNPTIIGNLVAGSIDWRVGRVDQCLLWNAGTKREQLLSMREQLASLPKPARVPDAVNLGERFLLLDCICYCHRIGYPLTGEIGKSGGEQHDWTKMRNGALDVLIDWNRILREGNDQYGTMLEAFNKSTPKEKMTALDSIERDQYLRKQNSVDWLIQLTNFYCDASTAATNRIRDRLFALVVSSPFWARLDQTREARRKLIDLGFALAIYKSDHDAYPDKLAELSPQYIKAVPKDIFSDAELHYTKKGSGYLLYSVGPDGKDDGAAGYDNPQAKPSDDIFVYVPVAAAKKK